MCLFHTTRAVWNNGQFTPGRCEKSVISHRPSKGGVKRLLFHTVPWKAVWKGYYFTPPQFFFIYHSFLTKGSVKRLLFHTAPQGRCEIAVISHRPRWEIRVISHRPPENEPLGDFYIVDGFWTCTYDKPSSPPSSSCPYTHYFNGSKAGRPWGTHMGQGNVH